MKNRLKPVALIILIMCLALLPACATSVSRLSSDGHNDEIIFPDIAKNTWMKEGTFPNIENLRLIAPDMTKDQVYALIGRPHFAEGIGKVREWDYLFNFRTQAGVEINNETQKCQYKIIYTPNMRLQTTFWKPESCVHKLDVKLAQAPSVIEETFDKTLPVKTVTKMQLSADGMFDFNRSSISHLRPGGIEKLDRLSANLLSSVSTMGEITELKIIGHTDRLGDEAYNIKLSQARAEIIRQYLIAKNIPAKYIFASGAGESKPLVECGQSKRDEVLIRCLEPNRRFEIEAWTTSNE